jgi:hypothetical protein
VAVGWPVLELEQQRQASQRRARRERRREVALGKVGEGERAGGLAVLVAVREQHALGAKGAQQRAHRPIAAQRAVKTADDHRPLRPELREAVRARGLQRGEGLERAGEHAAAVAAAPARNELDARAAPPCAL